MKDIFKDLLKKTVDLLEEIVDEKKNEFQEKKVVPRKIDYSYNNTNSINSLIDIKKTYTVNSFGSTIFFSGNICRESADDLFIEIVKVNSLISTINDENKQRGISINYIDLYINSSGGSLMDSFVIGDFISNSMYPINTCVQNAASGATIISNSGKKRFIQKNGLMLIHQLSSSSKGNYRELRDDFYNNTLFMDKIKKFYSEKTTMSNEKIEELLTKDIWLDAKTCLELGLVDKII